MSTLHPGAVRIRGRLALKRDSAGADELQLERRTGTVVERDDSKGCR